MRKNLKNQNGGFIETIVLIVIVLLVMRYYGVTLSGIYYWLKDLFLSIL